MPSVTFSPGSNLQDMPKTLLLSIVLLLSITAPALANTATPVLVELFTSEGCSSCPPADELLRVLDSTQPIAGAQLIVLSEHVDYWDDQGWRDPFSSHALTVRQENYVSRLHLASAYTPQMVVDGYLQFTGSDRARAKQALESSRNSPKVNVQVSSVKLEHGSIHAHLETGPLTSKAEVFVALTLDHAESQVVHGENGGHRLQHVAVVGNLTNLGTIKGAQAWSKDVSIALRSSQQAYRLVVFVQEPNQGRILGAAVERVQP